MTQAVIDEHQIINERLNLTGQQPTPSGPDGFGKSIGEQRARLAARFQETRPRREEISAQAMAPSYSRA
jgi:hypothetical protein